MNACDRDLNLLNKMSEHILQLEEEIQPIKSSKDFSKAGALRKAILFDLIQIGELSNHLSPIAQAMLSPKDISGSKGLRNVIVHGYGTVDDEEIWNTVVVNIPKLRGDVDRVREATTGKCAAKKK